MSRRGAVKWVFNFESMVADLKRVWNDLGRQPSFREYEARRDIKACPSKNMILKHIGSWNEFIAIAGGKPQTKRGGDTSKPFRKPNNPVACDYGGFVVHYSQGEYKRLQEVKARRADGRSRGAVL